MSKFGLKSKTFWVNVIAGVGLIAQANYGIVISPQTVAYLLIGINLLLRQITNEPIVWSKESTESTE